MNKNKSLGYRFAVLHRLYASYNREALKEIHIQTSEVPYMAELLKDGKAMTQDELSRRIAIDKGATARSLDSLEKKGFIVREVNPSNRRQKLISATEHSQKIATDFFSILASPAQVFLSGFSGVEQQTLYDYLDRMIETGMEAEYERDR